MAEAPARPITLPALDLPDFWPVAVPPPAPVKALNLPDAWPVAPLPIAPVPASPAPVVTTLVAAPTFEPFEVLAYRQLPEAWPVAEIPAAAAEPPPPPPAPKKKPAPPVPTVIAARSQRPKRFTWESPEMYWEEEEAAD